MFIAIETDLAERRLRQKQPFKWASADFGLDNEDFEQFIARSKSLCKGWEVIITLMF